MIQVLYNQILTSHDLSVGIFKLYCSTCILNGLGCEQVTVVMGGRQYSTYDQRCLRCSLEVPA